MESSSSYLPLPDSVTIKKSSLHGLGLFAAQDIEAGADLGVSHVADKRFPMGYIRLPLGGFLNYSATPNCECVQDGDLYRLKTLRHIKKGEELTDGYRPWYDEETLSSFK